MAASASAQAAFEQYERKKAIEAQNVPTDDLAMRKLLQKYLEPQALFGEDKAARRFRLQVVSYNRSQAGLEVFTGYEDAQVEEEPEEEEPEFYTEGPIELLYARHDIGRFSIPRARYKLAFQREESHIPLKKHVEHRKTIKDTLKQTTLVGTSTADRTVGCVRFSSDGSHILTSDWGGWMKMFKVPHLETVLNFKVHEGRTRSFAWLPGNTPSIDSQTASFVTGGIEGTVKIFAMPEEGVRKPTPLVSIQAHEMAVRTVAVHPSGRYFVSSADDAAWCLWPLRPAPPSSAEPLMVGDGHKLNCNTVSFDHTGSLLLSGGSDSYARIWDMRTGRNVATQDYHTSEIYTSDWAPDGIRTVTAGADGFGIVTDLRKLAPIARIPMHGRGVACIKWWRGNDTAAAYAARAADAEETGQPVPRPPTFWVGDFDDGPEELEEAMENPPPRGGTWLLSGGLDSNVGITSEGEWAPVKTLGGHEGNVLTVDASEDGRWIASGGSDRTLKVWGREDSFDEGDAPEGRLNGDGDVDMEG